MDAKQLDQQRRDLGVASLHLNDILANRADSERNMRMPWYPAISCARCGCDQIAKEMWHFCSRVCRDTFVRENSPE